MLPFQNKVLYLLIILNHIIMEKQIIVKERVMKLGGKAFEDAIDKAKNTNETITSFGVRIRRLTKQLIIL